MTLADYGAIGGIIAGVVAAVGLLYGIARFVQKVNTMDKAPHFLVTSQTPKIIEEFNKRTSTSQFNLGLPDEMKALLDKLGGRKQPTSTEANRLIEMLKDKQAETKRKGQKDAVHAISMMIILVRLLAERQSRNFG